MFFMHLLFFDLTMVTSEFPLTIVESLHVYFRGLLVTFWVIQLFFQ